MNILWLSCAPWAPTGYGSQTAQAVTRMKAAGHNVAISCSSGIEWAQWEWNGIHLYPSDYTRLNKRVLRSHVADWAQRCECSPEDVQVISLFDIWPWIDRAPAYGSILADFKGLRMAAWLPVDHYPLPPKTVMALDAFDVTPIAMSKFGEETLREAGRDPLYVPHAIDTTVYRPHDDRDACKKGKLGIDPDRFVIGMVANNAGMQPSRKAFPNVLQAFAAFRREHEDAVLYLHTEVTGSAQNGLNLLAIAEMFSIPADALVLVSQVPYLCSAIPPELMSAIYSGMDVLASPSYGEGFGLPILEAQACGTPVITTAWTSMPELTGAGWQVGGQPWYNESSGAMWMHPATDEILAAFEAAYEARGDQELRQKARSFALDYNADTVFEEHWVPALEALSKPREVPPLLNREQRRKLAKAKA